MAKQIKGIFYSFIVDRKVEKHAYFLSNLTSFLLPLYPKKRGIILEEKIIFLPTLRILLSISYFTLILYIHVIYIVILVNKVIANKVIYKFLSLVYGLFPSPMEKLWAEKQGWESI